MRIVIYEDQKIYNDMLRDYIEKYIFKNNIEIDLLFAKNPIQLMEYNNIDEIVLNIIDIEHLNENTDGITMSKRIKEKKTDANIIFLTSHIENMYDVLNDFVQPLAYIYKGDLNMLEILENAINTLFNRFIDKEEPSIFKLKNDRGELVYIKMNEIHFITSSHRQKYVDIYTEKEIIKVKGTLKDFLDKPPLVQISKSGIINKTKIKSVAKDRNPRNRVINTDRIRKKTDDMFILTPKYKKNLL